MHAQLFGEPDVSQVKTLLISMKKVITAVLSAYKPSFDLMHLDFI